MQPQYTPAEIARFWAKVDRDGPVPAHCPELGPCWVWTAASYRGGYGQLTLRQRKLSAHRLAWVLTYGPLSDELEVCHRCDYPPCCRPSHLFSADAAGNAADMRAKGRSLTGDRNSSRRHPERLARGDQHPGRLYPGLQQGERNGHARLTAEQVRAIRARYAVGDISTATLAREYGIGQPTVVKIVLRQRWAHLQ